MLVNVALNARDAMPAGGELRIATSIVAGAGGRVDGPGRPTIRITVTDTGVGMDSNTLGHRFEPVRTTEGGGKGTGSKKRKKGGEGNGMGDWGFGVGEAGLGRGREGSGFGGQGLGNNERTPPTTPHSFSRT